MNSKKVILAKPADWDAWIFFVRARATSSNIWTLVNPDLAEKPVALAEPEELQYVEPEVGETVKDAIQDYKDRKEIYKPKLAKYERQEKAFGDPITLIQDMITAYNVTFIQSEEPHPWDILRALKQRLAPSDQARSLEIKQNYHRLCKGPGSQNVEAWLDEWTLTFTKATEYSIAEVTGSRPVRDFLMAIRTKEPTFANTHFILLKHLQAGNLYEIVEDFRQHVWLQQLSGPAQGESHSAFPTKSTSNTPIFRGQQTPPKPCLCGDLHWVSDCAYLVSEKRTKGWKPDAAK